MSGAKLQPVAKKNCRMLFKTWRCTTLRKIFIGLFVYPG